MGRTVKLCIIGEKIKGHEDYLRGLKLAAVNLTQHSYFLVRKQAMSFTPAIKTS